MNVESKHIEDVNSLIPLLVLSWRGNMKELYCLIRSEINTTNQKSPKWNWNTILLIESSSRILTMKKLAIILFGFVVTHLLKGCSGSSNQMLKDGYYYKILVGLHVKVMMLLLLEKLNALTKMVNLLTIRTLWLNKKY